MCLTSVGVYSIRLAGPLALKITEVTLLVDYEARTASVFGTATLSVTHRTGLHQLHDGLLINEVLRSGSEMRQEKRAENEKSGFFLTI